jgi:hypothetical protein
MFITEGTADRQLKSLPEDLDLHSPHLLPRQLVACRSPRRSHDICARVLLRIEWLVVTQENELPC